VDSSEVWHVFRVGRRARIRHASVSFHDGGFTAQAVHDGYRHLAGRPLHARRVNLENRGRLLITDRVSGADEHRVSAGLLLDPRWNCRPDGVGWRLNQGNIDVRIQVSANRRIHLVRCERPIHPFYHVEQSTQRLEWHYDGPLPIEVTTTITGVPCISSY
jgi:hypothetical protein